MFSCKSCQDLIIQSSMVRFSDEKLTPIKNTVRESVCHGRSYLVSSICRRAASADNIYESTLYE